MSTIGRCSMCGNILYDATRRLKLPKFRSANVVEITLQPKDGVIKKTFSDSHYSWWRSTDFEVSQAKTIEL